MESSLQQKALNNKLEASSRVWQICPMLNTLMYEERLPALQESVIETSATFRQSSKPPTHG
jgi:hypothetical protein